MYISLYRYIHPQIHPDPADGCKRSYTLFHVPVQPLLALLFIPAAPPCLVTSSLHALMPMITANPTRTVLPLISQHEADVLAPK